MNPGQAIEKIRAELIESGRDTRYKINAYGFVLNGLEFYIMKIGEKRHLSGQELAAGLAEFAIKQFGPLTSDVLQNWGITKTDDFGNIVYNLIGINLMCKQEGDTLEDFNGVFDLQARCGEPDFFQLDPAHIRSIKGA